MILGDCVKVNSHYIQYIYVCSLQIIIKTWEIAKEMSTLQKYLYSYVGTGRMYFCHLRWARRLWPSVETSLHGAWRLRCAEMTPPPEGAG